MARLLAAQQGVDAARESTFPFLDDSAAARDAYALSSLWWAEVCLLEPQLLQHQPTSADAPSGSASDAADNPALRETHRSAAAAALRACDLALLRGGVDEWAAAAAPLMQWAAHLQSGANPQSGAAASPGGTHAASTPGPAASGSTTADPAPSAVEAAAAAEAERVRWETKSRQYVRGTLRGGRSLPRVSASSLSATDFQSRCLTPSNPPPEPVVLQGLASDWPALTTRPWSDSEYLKRLGGSRLVRKSPHTPNHPLPATFSSSPHPSSTFSFFASAHWLR
jgi:hypothetical protein